jgi:hypothetical protein
MDAEIVHATRRLKRWLTAFGVLTFAIGLSLVAFGCDVPATTPEANACWGLRPLCMSPQHPVCMCQNYGTNCFWVCM